MALACAAAWLSLAPPLLAEDALAPDEELGPVALVRPPDGAAAPASRGGAGVSLTWHPSRSASVAYFVEVIALSPDEPREVFTGYTRQPELRLRVDEPGQYVWRVLAVSRARARYSVSPWWSFTVEADALKSTR